MRILPAALAVSAVLHGAAIAYVQTRPVSKPAITKAPSVELIQIEPPPAAEPPPSPRVTSPSSPHESGEMMVTLFDDHTVATTQPALSSAGNRKPGKARISTGHTTATETGTATTTTTEPQKPRSSLMTMRHPELKNGPSADFWARFEANTKPLQPKEIAGEQLADEVATAEEHLNNPRWIANASADEVLAEREKLVAKKDAQDSAELKPDGAGTKAEHHSFKARFSPDGTVASLDDKRNLRIHGLSGEFDVTDAMMRRHGQDPYASYKLKVLDETRDERAAMGKRYRTQQLAQSRQLMQRNLDRLWASTLDLAARKQGLFELWDDCAETGSDELVTGGTSARSQLVGFVRTKLPAGSANAFTAGELARFNKQRKSRAEFSPYADAL